MPVNPRLVMKASVPQQSIQIGTSQISLSFLGIFGSSRILSDHYNLLLSDLGLPAAILSI
jgi:hypothetical protein